MLLFVVLCFIQHVYQKKKNHKASVNAQPLSPPFFEEIAAHNKNVIFFLICVFAFAFFYLFHIVVDFRVSLADALGQIGFILNRCWCHCWSNFPAFSAARAKLLQNFARNFARNFSRNSQRTCRELSRKLQEMQRTCRELAANYAKDFPKSEISSGVFNSSTRQQEQQTSSYKRGGGGTRACALG